MEQLFEYSQDFLCILDKDRHITYANPRLKAFWGDRIGAPVAIRLDEFILEKELADFMRNWQIVRESGRTEHIFLHLRSRAGSFDPFVFTLIQNGNQDQVWLIGHPHKPGPKASLSSDQGSPADDHLSELLSENALLKEELKQMVYIVSHDLTGPLRTIVSYAQIAQDSYQKGKPQYLDESLAMVIGGGTRMSEMIKAILEISRIQRYVLRPQWIDLTGVVGDMIEQLQLRYPAQLVQVDVHPLPRVWMDKLYLYKLLDYLLDNAFTYSREEPISHVEIRFEVSDTGGTLSIQDNGIGIQPKHQTRIFQLFQRLHSDEEY